ncbi:hypothetical protein [Streptomyces formicae]
MSPPAVPTLTCTATSDDKKITFTFAPDDAPVYCTKITIRVPNTTGSDSALSPWALDRIRVTKPEPHRTVPGYAWDIHRQTHSDNQYIDFNFIPEQIPAKYDLSTVTRFALSGIPPTQDLGSRFFTVTCHVTETSTGNNPALTTIRVSIPATTVNRSED